MSGRGESTFRFLCRWADRIERAVLTVLVTGMVGLATLQILLRNVWHTGLNWAEPLLGMALLWLTMLGALAAAGLGRHLSIDLAAAYSLACFRMACKADSICFKTGTEWVYIALLMVVIL